MTEPTLLEAKSIQDWVVDKAPSGLTPKSIYIGDDPNQMALEVAIASTSNSAVSREALAKLHKVRLGNKAYPLVVVALSDSNAWLFGPSSSAAIIGPIDRGQALRLLQSALVEPNSIAATQRLAQVQVHVGTSSKLGITNSGLFASHHLNNNVPKQANWNEACQNAQANLSKSGIDLINGLGFTAKRAAADAVILTGGSPNPRAVAVLLDEAEHFDASSPKYQLSPVAYGLKVAHEQDVPWLILLRGGQIRLYPAKDGIGVGQRGQADTFFELDLALLADEDAGLLDLIFSVSALAPGGTTEQVLRDSTKYATELGSRLKNRIYENVIPELSKAVAAQLPNIGVKINAEGLQVAYRLTLRILFRLLFQAYAEDRGLLPYDRNERYTNNALKTLVIRDLIPNTKNVFDQNAQTLWDDLTQVWHAIDGGASAWNVPAYNGGLFGEEEDLHYEGYLIKQITMRDDAIGPALKHMFVDVTDEGVQGPVDFRSLSVREFGTIYEGLLESSLSLADQDLTVDSKGAWVPAKKDDLVLAPKGSVYFHSSSGERKATGSYFTPSAIVDHLLDRALEPALEQHLAKVKAELDSGNETRAHEIFFDFRVADLAMGSGHFLVSAVDRIESAMRNFLVENNVPGVSRELQRLETAAKEALGDDYQFAGDIDKAGLLRRQIARRCIYGLDINPLAVELSRLALWIHTFVPGLPMSSLDHGLVCANSLTGIGTIDEALYALEPNSPGGQLSIFEDAISDALEKAKNLLIDAANADEANKQEVKDASKIAKQARKAAESTRHIFDAAVAARLGEINSASFASPDSVRAIGSSDQVQTLATVLNPAHMPYLFPEVFLRDNAGFDVLLGNPPWEELVYEEIKFWSSKFPGLKGHDSARQSELMQTYRNTRPDLHSQMLKEMEVADSMREVLMKGPFPGLGTGHPDLYKAFIWRYLQLSSKLAHFGVVLPRSVLTSAGAELWRKSLLETGSILQATTLKNSGGWVFPDIGEMLTVVALSASKVGDHSISISGPHNSLTDFVLGVDNVIKLEKNEVESWSESFTLPNIDDTLSLGIYRKMRRHKPLKEWRNGQFKPLQGDFNQTTDRALWKPISQEDLTVFKGNSFDIWCGDRGIPFASAASSEVVPLLKSKRARQLTLSSSPYFKIPLKDERKLQIFEARIAFRDVVRSTDTRTLIAALIPPRTVLTNKAPYLVNRDVTELKSEAFLLGVISSMIMDWFCRKEVELSFNFHIFNRLPIPIFHDGDICKAVVEIAGKLAAIDDRYATWAENVGVSVGSVANDQIKEDLIAELDALVSLLYGLDESDVAHIFKTFHRNLDYKPRLDAVLNHFHDWKDKNGN